MSEPEDTDHTKEDTEKRTQLFEEQVRETWKIIQKGSEDFDKSILTYSSSALGLSITFVQNIVPKDQAVYPFYLHVAWVLFTAAIVFTIASFKISTQAQYKHLKHCRKYYIDRQDEYLDKKNWWNIANEVATSLAGLCFALGVGGIAVFGILNFQEAQKMSDKIGLPTGDLQRGAPTTLKIPISPATPPAAAPQPAPSNPAPSSTGGPK
jgi:hypothetical protein